MITYPAGALPLPQADYSSKPVTNVATTTFASGRVRRRRLGAGKYRAAKLTWQLSPEEYDFFCGWWEHVLRLGTEQFTINMATGAIFGPHVVLMVGEPDETLQGYFWKVSCDIVVYSKPELPEHEVAILTEGLTLEEFPAVEDEFDTLVNVSIPLIME